MFYIPSALQSVLRDKYYAHSFLLTKAMIILLATKITQEHLNLAEILLKDFCKLMEKYYGKMQ